MPARIRGVCVRRRIIAFAGGAEYNADMPHPTHMPMRIPISTLLLVALACTRNDERAPVPAGPFAVEVAPRANAQVVGADTLSEAARLVELHPEADGDAVMFIFSDSVRGVRAGLALSDRRGARTQLLWPDSVTAAWWPRPHDVAFTTGTGAGARLVVDVHAESLRTVVVGADSNVTKPTRGDTADATIRARATAWLDSARVQPTGQPQGTSLRYQVTAVLPDPTGALAAFHVTASESGSAKRSNPAWYLLDRASGAVSPVAEIVGPAEEMPASAAGWTGDGVFIFGRGMEILGARRVAPGGS